MGRRGVGVWLLGGVGSGDSMVGIRGIIREGIGVVGTGMRRGRRRGGGGWISRGFGGVELKGG